MIVSICGRGHMAKTSQRSGSGVKRALTALHTTGKGILAKMLTFVFDKCVSREEILLGWPPGRRTSEL